MSKKMAQGAIAATPGTLAYTVPSGRKFVYEAKVTCIDIANTTGGALSISLYLVPVGGTPSASNMLLPAVSIAANTALQWKGEQVLNAGDFIQAIGSATGLTMNISGEEYRI